MDISELSNAAALRSCVELEPIEGPGGRVFPPTYPTPEGARPPNDKPRHVVEPYEVDGQKRQRVLIDSVASQANRQEAALVAGRRAGRVRFPDLRVDLSATRAEMDELLVSELPHRLADAIVRDSEIDGVRFEKSDIGKSILASSASDLTPIFEVSPTTLIFGAWFSQWHMPRPLRLQRLTSSEVWADDAVLGYTVGSRIDPLGIEKMNIYRTEDGDWTVNVSYSPNFGH